MSSTIKIFYGYKVTKPRINKLYIVYVVTLYILIKFYHDINYGDNKQNPFFIEHFGFKRLMLLAQKVEFIHPITKEQITIEAEFDLQWLQVFDELAWDAKQIN